MKAVSTVLFKIDSILNSTLFLKLAIFLIGTPVLIVGILGLIGIVGHPVNPAYANMLYPIIMGMYGSAIPFYTALFNAFKLLMYIEKDKAFSQLSVTALKKIKYCAITFSALYVIIMPFVYLLAEKDDAPGLIIIFMVPIFASLIIAVFATVLQKLLQEAIAIKSENDLTV